MRFIDATLQTRLGATVQLFRQWLPQAESHFEDIKSIKIMYIHVNGVIFTSYFALKAKLPSNQGPQTRKPNQKKLLS
jgi:hypothetical protein